MATKSLIGWFPVLGAPDCPVGGTGPSGAPSGRWPSTDMATSRWLAGTPNYLALHMDSPVNYSRHRLKFPRTGCLADRAPNYAVGCTEPFGATQSSPPSPFSI
jgi:hypothetical protein